MILCTKDGINHYPFEIVFVNDDILNVYCAHIKK